MLLSAFVSLSLYRNGPMCFELCTGHHTISRLLVFPSSNLKCGNQDVSICFHVGSYLSVQFMAPVWCRGQRVAGLTLGSFTLPGAPAPCRVLGCACSSAAAAPGLPLLPPSTHRAPALTTLADGFPLRTLICFSS